MSSDRSRRKGRATDCKPNVSETNLVSRISGECEKHEKTQTDTSIVFLFVFSPRRSTRGLSSRKFNEARIMRKEILPRGGINRSHVPAATYRYATPHRSCSQAPSHALIAASDLYSRRGFSLLSKDPVSQVAQYSIVVGVYTSNSQISSIYIFGRVTKEKVHDINSTWTCFLRPVRI